MDTTSPAMSSKALTQGSSLSSQEASVNESRLTRTYLGSIQFNPLIEPLTVDVSHQPTMINNNKLPSLRCTSKTGNYSNDRALIDQTNNFPMKPSISEVRNRISYHRTRIRF